MIKAGQDGIETDFIIQVVAGEGLTANDACYINTSDGKAYKCDADDLTKMDFVGFANETVSAAANINLVCSGVMPGLSGLTVGAIYYLSGTAGGITSTVPSNAKRVGIAVKTTVLRIDQTQTKITTVFTANARKGSGSTQFDITNPAGTTFRYTWDSTGTDPNINSGTIPIGSIVEIKSPNFSSANSGFFVTTGVGANYFEVTNASGVVESNKTLATGYLLLGGIWTKRTGLKFIEIEVQAAGGCGGRVNVGGAGGGGGGGGYGMKRILASSLGSTENYIVGSGGPAATAAVGAQDGHQGGNSRFGSHVVALGGIGVGNDNAGGAGGTCSSGDLNIQGGYGSGGTEAGGVSGAGGGSRFGFGGGGVADNSQNGIDGTGYGAGGSGGIDTGSGSVDGGAGSNGVIILTEYF